MTAPKNSPAPSHGRANRLAREKSPYLLQHQHNPVDWYAWGEEAFAKARAENKPIFLSIGYSTCHWCHVMERESFENEAVARISQRAFREHQGGPRGAAGRGQDLHDVRAVHDRRRRLAVELFSHAGPEAVLRRHLFSAGKQIRAAQFPAKCCKQISKLWETRRGDVADSASQLHEKLEEITARPGASGPAADARRARPTRRRSSSRCTTRATAGSATRRNFRSRASRRFCCATATRFKDAEAVRMVLHTCERMAAGGIHDQLGGGFARYSVDAEWLVPHFEKMLYDNAQLANLYLDAFLVSGDARHADTARDILRLCVARHDASRGRILFRRGRRQRGQGGQVLLLDARGAVATADAGGIQRGGAIFRHDGAGQFRRPQRSASVAEPKCVEHRRTRNCDAGGRTAAGVREGENVRRAREAGASASGRQGAGVLERADAGRDGAGLRGAGR